MNWDDLRFFLAVAGAGSLSGAGQQLGVNTTTVLRRVASLEEDLGARLFERERTGYRLTAAGEKLVETLEPVDRRLSALPRDFAAAGEGAEGTVRLAAGETIAAFLLAVEFPAFRKEHPGLELEILTDPRLAAVGQAPKIGNPLKDVDIALRLARPTQGDMLMRKLGDMAYGLYASPAYLEARGKPLHMQDIAGHDLIGFPRAETPLGPVWWFSRAEKSARITLRSSSVLARAEAARQDLGLTALPCMVGDVEAGVQRVFGPDTLGSLEMWLLTRNDLAQLAHVRAVMEFVVDAVKQHRSQLEGRDHEVRELMPQSRPNH
ncbi:LysR family transcriptional regulator [Parvibaculum sp.]|jgi:DNA-binding transcriptional LysR family regulator|uniref:LysR family transcriptional regulator n=1 Tax=Parvibaculum sp. TaxID=2024848 RepID=UPI000C4F0C45|nr:LysR family transcriptional regulator [Parvibaculum sp.]MAM94163.1 LysR family transcriptional regulator [Parvibaculum sp.]HCX68535.1 LysR family transcriptional regulator [Rhodobiaceae bacterium]|tara:strand:+ start:34273 stop:35232 length:960 start_codon:yes stop_codon:yes gene_type:complete